MTPTPVATSLDLTEAAAFLGLHPDTLRERAASGLIPGAKLGKRWVFLDVDLADWMRLRAPNARLTKPHPYIGTVAQLVKLYVPPARLWMRRKRNIGKAPTWAGVYFLYANDTMIYVGSSRSIRDRIMQHASAGRVFDQFAYVKAPGEAVVALEAVYIAMLQPLQNKQTSSKAALITDALMQLWCVGDWGEIA